MGGGGGGGSAGDGGDGAGSALPPGILADTTTVEGNSGDDSGPDGDATDESKTVAPPLPPPVVRPIETKTIAPCSLTRAILKVDATLKKRLDQKELRRLLGEQLISRLRDAHLLPYLLDPDRVEYAEREAKIRDAAAKALESLPQKVGEKAGEDILDTLRQSLEAKPKHGPDGPHGPGEDDGEAEEQAAKQEEARPLWDAFQDWLTVTRTQVLDQGPMARAIDYTLSNWDALLLYLEDGRLPIDNNAAERSLRGVCVGRKNWWVLGHENGGRTAAILFSLIETCKEIGVNPRDYLYDVLRRLSKCSDVAKLTPHGWKANFQEEVAAKRDELLALFLDST